MAVFQIESEEVIDDNIVGHAGRTVQSIILADNGDGTVGTLAGHIRVGLETQKGEQFA